MAHGLKERFMRHWQSLAVLGLVIVGLQVAGSVLTVPQLETWYRGLNRPVWTPPDAVFAPVWTVLYVTIWLSGWLVWTSVAGTVTDKRKHPAIRFYALQLVLNFLWTPLFFHFHMMTVALAEMIVLIVVTGLTIYHARAVHRVAAAMLVPYVLWLFYAMTVNAGFAYLN